MAKELSWQFIHETGGRKYFLVKRADSQYFIFRTPPASPEKSKNRAALANWEGEVVPWGSTPVKVRDWMARKRIGPDPKKPEILVVKT